jgi:hypothetical protein
MEPKRGAPNVLRDMLALRRVLHEKEAQLSPPGGDTGEVFGAAAAAVGAGVGERGGEQTCSACRGPLLGKRIRMTRAEAREHKAALQRAAHQAHVLQRKQDRKDAEGRW